MKLRDLLDLANEAYPDAYLSEYYDEEMSDEEVEDDPQAIFLADSSGDTLAETIVIELIDAYRTVDNRSDVVVLASALQSLERLMSQLMAVRKHLNMEFIRAFSDASRRPESTA